MKQIILIVLFIATSTSCAAHPPGAALDTLVNSRTEKVKVGRFSSRGIWTPSTKKAPAILMLPGSGPQGPEEMLPGKMTVDGKDAPLFLQMAKPFVDAGFNVLSLGKPGVDFFSSWDPKKMFYDESMLKELTWQNLIDNAEDGLTFLKKQGSVDANQIYVLGHSEGTQVATDIAKKVPLAGLILLGYSGEDLLTTMEWQMSDRTVEYFVKTDVDADHDGYITQTEANKWLGLFAWSWKEGQEKVSVKEVRDAISQDPRLKEILDATRKSHFCSASGKCERGPIYRETAQFKGPIYVFTGKLDLQTRAVEALKLRETCKQIGKQDCFVEIVPGLQHGFSPPRPPRSHPLLDITVGPVENLFQKRLSVFAEHLLGKSQQ